MDAASAIGSGGTAGGGIDRTQLPADVRSASREDQARYAAALQFEQMLVQKMLTQTLTGSGDGGVEEDSGDEEGSGSADAVSANYRQMLPDLMAHAMTSGGGTGLARSLYDAMRDRAAAESGTPAGSSPTGGARAEGVA